MNNYQIEGQINFFEELYKSLDEDSDNEEDNLCQITGLQLENNFITLECKHKFNYLALYKEICRQKFEFKTYETNLLSKDEQIKIKNSNLDYFIKCPYCRNIQFTILPEYEELGLAKKYGVNSLDPNLPSKNTQIIYIPYGHENYTFSLYGVLFKKGICCEKIIDPNKDTNNLKNCKYKYCATIPNTELQYCKNHYKKGLKEYKISEKNKKSEEKKKQKEELIKEKQNQLENINKERLAKGLPVLKRLIKKSVENFIISGQEISIFIPESDNLVDLVGCKAILKSGSHKGKPCGIKLINENCLCKRHNKN